MSLRRSVLAGAVTSALLLVSCGFPTQDEASPVVDDRPSSLITDPPGGVRATESTTVWFIADDELQPVTRRLASPVEAADMLGALLEGVSPAESARALRSAVPSGDMVRSVATSEGRADVDLAVEFADIPAGDQLLALAQIVYTLTDLRGIGRVRFTVDDVPVVVPLPDGESTEGSVSRDDFAALVGT